MDSKIHFISGLPRAGSTLLSALLRQNPRFHAAVTSPVAMLVGTFIPKMSGGTEYATFFDNERRRAILKGLFSAYYADIPSGRIVFDTNRAWTSKTALLRALYPEARIICCVREIGWIIDSIERMLRKNPLQASRIFNFQLGSSVYGRAEAVMNMEKGIVGTALSALREAWFSENAKQLIVVNYDRLAREPQLTIRRLYEELGEPAFEHDFENVTHDDPQYDAFLGMPGLHTVRGKVEYREREPSIPPDIFSKYVGSSPWLDPRTNPRKAVVL